jgi:hypothetical protein
LQREERLLQIRDVAEEERFLYREGRLLQIRDPPFGIR